MDRLISAHPRTIAIVHEVERFCDEHGFGPTIYELADAVGLSSGSTVVRHIQHAVELGLLSQSGQQARTIRPVRSRCSHGRP